MGRNQIKTCELIAKTLTKGKSTADVSPAHFLKTIEEIAGSDQRTKAIYSRLLFEHDFARQLRDKTIRIVSTEEGANNETKK